MLDEPEWRGEATLMMGAMSPFVEKHGNSFARWGQLLQHLAYPTPEIVIAGPTPHIARAQLEEQRFLPTALFMGAEPGAEDMIPLLAGKSPKDDENTFFICYNRSCRQPVTSVEAAEEELAEALEN
jgi:uncharacterized protein YyaL (SSP411 family)